VILLRSSVIAGTTVLIGGGLGYGVMVFPAPCGRVQVSMLACYPCPVPILATTTIATVAYWYPSAVRVVIGGFAICRQILGSEIAMVHSHPGYFASA